MFIHEEHRGESDKEAVSLFNKRHSTTLEKTNVTLKIQLHWIKEITLQTENKQFEAMLPVSKEMRMTSWRDKQQSYKGASANSYRFQLLCIPWSHKLLQWKLMNSRHCRLGFGLSTLKWQDFLEGGTGAKNGIYLQVKWTFLRRLCIVGLLRTRTTSSTDIMDASKLPFTPANLWRAEW